MKKWTITEIEWIKANCAKYTLKEMAGQLEVSEEQVRNAMKNRGIKTGRDGKFKKGYVPPNKGTRGLMRRNSGTFKKGHRPHNELDGVGHISVRMYKRAGKARKMIKIATGRWMLLNRYIWEQAHGSIPKGMMIMHKDGDALNCDISNLSLISRAENALRNINREKQSKTIKRTWDKTRRMKKYGVNINGFSRLVKNLY